MISDTLAAILTSEAATRTGGGGVPRFVIAGTVVAARIYRGQVVVQVATERDLPLPELALPDDESELNARILFEGRTVYDNSDLGKSITLTYLHDYFNEGEEAEPRPPVTFTGLTPDQAKAIISLVELPGVPYDWNGA